MAGRCDICEKTRVFGSNVSHSKRHTRRSWKPNTHAATLTIDGMRVRANLCTRCLRTLHKTEK